MKAILETDHEFICDIDAPCFQMLSRGRGGIGESQ